MKHDGATTVLIVDDSASMCDLLRTPLEADGYQVHTAATMDDGLRLARELQPDVILIDFVLPDGDGLLLLRALRAAGVGSLALALTGSANPDVAIRFLREGAVDFLSKDRMSTGDVRAAIQRALTVHEVEIRMRPGPSAETDPPGRARAYAPPDDPSDSGELPARPLRILVVDDDRSARALVRDALDREAWTIHEAPDFERALVSIRTAPPDVVLLDYVLPDVDRITAIEHLRRAGLRAPVIALSGHGSEEVAIRFMRAGATDFLGKDQLLTGRLVHAIRRAVDLHGVAERG